MRKFGKVRCEDTYSKLLPFSSIWLLGLVLYNHMLM